MSDNERIIVVNKGGGACSVFLGLFLFFIVLPFVTIVGCFACGTAALLNQAATDSKKQPPAPKVESGDKQADAFFGDKPRESKPDATPANDAVPDDFAKPVTPPPPGVRANPSPDDRLWRSTSGTFQVEAAFVEFADGKVRLRKLDGTIIAVPIQQLSEEDQQYVRSKVFR